MVQPSPKQFDQSLGMKEETKIERRQRSKENECKETAAQSLKSSRCDNTSQNRALKGNKQRQLNKDSKVLMLKIERGKRMKKEFRLYHDSDIFKNMPDGTNLVL